jgi:hypothetical protein
MRPVTDFDAPTYAAIDPGGVTGVAFYAPGDGFWSAEVPGGSAAFAPSWRDLLRQRTVVHIIVEKFTITPATATKTRQYDALEIIGWLKLECPHLGIPLTIQTPAAAKAFSTDAKLKALGWYDRTPGGHRNDAARHLCKFLVDQREPVILKKLEEGL